MQHDERKVAVIVIAVIITVPSACQHTIKSIRDAVQRSTICNAECVRVVYLYNIYYIYI